MVTSHAQALSGLTGNTTYHFHVKSRDAAGNLATSGDFTFATLDAAAPVISAVASSGISATGATITWTTSEASDTQVDCGTTTAYGSSTTLNTSMVTYNSQARRMIEKIRVGPLEDTFPEQAFRLWQDAKSCDRSATRI
jgi:hypothetical protein